MLGLWLCLFCLIFIQGFYYTYTCTRTPVCMCQVFVVLAHHTPYCCPSASWFSPLLQLSMEILVLAEHTVFTGWCYVLAKRCFGTHTHIYTPCVLILYTQDTCGLLGTESNPLSCIHSHFLLPGLSVRSSLLWLGRNYWSRGVIVNPLSWPSLLSPDLLRCWV